MDFLLNAVSGSGHKQQRHDPYVQGQGMNNGYYNNQSQYGSNPYGGHAPVAGYGVPQQGYGHGHDGMGHLSHGHDGMGHLGHGSGHNGYNMHQGDGYYMGKNKMHGHKNKHSHNGGYGNHSGSDSDSD